MHSLRDQVQRYGIFKKFCYFSWTIKQNLVPVFIFVSFIYDVKPSEKVVNDYYNINNILSFNKTVLNIAFYHFSPD